MRACLAELLRTAHHPRSLLLRVEKVVPQRDTDDKTSGHKTAQKSTRLYLTDEELIVQALVLPELHLSIKVGDILDIRRFEVFRARRKTRPGQILFLGIQDCEVLPREASTADTSREQGGFIREALTPSPPPASSSRKRRYSETTRGQSPTPAPVSEQPKRSMEAFDSEEALPVTTMEPPGSQSSDDFETSTPDAAATQRRRQALHEIDRAVSPHFSKSPSRIPDVPERAEPEVVSPIASPSLTDLASLPSLAPSTAITVLAIITWTGQTLLRPSRAFPPKRHIKLHDPSIAHLFTGVSLATYVDAPNFKPERGTIALLQDVVVQRCASGGGEVSHSHMLNAYPSLPEKLEVKGEQLPWFVDDEDTLRAMGLGEKIDEMRIWWEQRETKRAGGATPAS